MQYILKNPKSLAELQNADKELTIFLDDIAAEAQRNIEVKKASIGHISKKDISDAQTNFEKDPLQCAILGFNICINLDRPSSK